MKRRLHSNTVQNLWTHIESGKINYQLLWELMFNCRQVKVRAGVDQQTLLILASKGCGSLGHGFYLCPTISIALSLLRDSNCAVYDAFVWKKLADHISRSLPDSNAWLITSWFFVSDIQTKIKYEVKLILAEAESMWLNFWRENRN